jgi:hypothetical protein
MKEIVSIKIILNGTRPIIWRKILIPVTATFDDLHHAIQISMGWWNAHLYEFEMRGGYKIGKPDPELDFERRENAEKIKLDIISTRGEMEFTYMYDFGDWWSHTIDVEGFVNKEEGRNYPLCTDGRFACPPEDSGGIYGFYDKLKILKNEKHREHADIKSWMGPDYDPKKFDIDKANETMLGFFGKRKTKKRSR